jgi:outer membrane protein assembly factor BamD
LTDLARAVSGEHKVWRDLPGLVMRSLLRSGWMGAVALTMLLSACGGNKKDAYIEKPVDDLYNQAMDEMVEERYDQAATSFDQVESQHPYSVWATKAQLMAAYAQYEGGNYDEAIINADRFIQLHPGNRDVVYAYYLKAISYYVQIVDVERDQKTTELALKALDDVVRRFPDTKYARDAKLKLDFTRDHLAGKELEIGRYYLKRGQYLAAMNRFKRVIDQYQTTTHVPEALERLVECDLALGLTAEAKQNAAVLGYNYPGSEWYGDAFALLKGSQEPDAQTQSWLGRTIGSLF